MLRGNRIMRTMFGFFITLLALAPTYPKPHEVEAQQYATANDIVDAPVYMYGTTLLGSDTASSKMYGPFSPDSAIKLSNRFLTRAEKIFAFDTLRVVVSWAHPTDGLGNEDSTTFRIKASKAIRFNGGGTVGANLWRYRKHNDMADTFKVLLPLGDSVFFSADSIRQCRGGKCSAIGSNTFGYKRTTAPPAMTFIQVQFDSIP